MNNSTNIHPFKIFVFLFAILLITFFSCRKEKPELAEEVNPCDCATEVSAEFDILERLGNFGNPLNTFTLTDNILGDKNVKFRAHEEDAQYTWYLGTEVITEREFLRFFSSQWVNATIPISLVVEKQPNKLCFPNDDGRDSITKYMTVFDRCDTSILEGTFRIAEENSLDSMDITIDFLDYTYASNTAQPTLNDCRGINIYNYDGEGSDCLESTATVIKNYRYFKYGQTPSHPHSCDMQEINEAHLDLNDRFSVIIFTKKNLGGTSFETKTRQMYGRKL